MDVGLPFAPRFDLVALRNFVAELDVRGAVEAEIGLFVGGGWAIGVGGDFAVAVLEEGVGGASEARECGREGAGEDEGGVGWWHDGVCKGHGDVKVLCRTSTEFYCGWRVAARSAF